VLIFLRLLAILPLRALHALGAFAGNVVYWASPRYRRRLRENLGTAMPNSSAKSDVDSGSLLPVAIAEAGKAMFETPAVWFKPPSWVNAVMVKIDDWARIEALLARGKGIVFLTPHLGCFEITAQYYALHHPITVLFRPPRKDILAPLMAAGRGRSNLIPVPANARGVRALLKALKRGEAIGMLPDQAPAAGEGAWADFFGRPAYTMTLAGRLLRSSGAPVVLAFAERLPHGAGYHLHLEQGPVPAESDANGETYETALNRALEKLISRCPAQYLWAYDRYKTPKRARPESGAGERA
jgi:KDO2-lipid IV(A) lauroyltransferase